jgi:hypothetical protein
MGVHALSGLKVGEISHGKQHYNYFDSWIKNENSIIFFYKKMCHNTLTIRYNFKILSFLLCFKALIIWFEFLLLQSVRIIVSFPRHIFRK